MKTVGFTQEESWKEAAKATAAFAKASVERCICSDVGVGRRVKWLPVHVDVLLVLFKFGPSRGAALVGNGLPEDARCLDVVWDGEYMHLLIESDTYDEVGAGAVPTADEPLFMRIHPGGGAS